MAEEVNKDEIKKDEIKKDETKEPEKKKKRHIIFRMFDILVWLILFACLSTAVIDYVNIINNKEPKFCIEKNTKTHEDGKEYYCKGILYESYVYERESKTGYLIIPFWEHLKK